MRLYTWEDLEDAFPKPPFSARAPFSSVWRTYSRKVVPRRDTAVTVILRVTAVDFLFSARTFLADILGTRVERVEQLAKVVFGRSPSKHSVHMILCVRKFHCLPASSLLVLLLAHNAVLSQCLPPPPSVNCNIWTQDRHRVKSGRSGFPQSSKRIRFFSFQFPPRFGFFSPQQYRVVPIRVCQQRASAGPGGISGEGEIRVECIRRL